MWDGHESTGQIGSSIQTEEEEKIGLLEVTEGFLFGRSLAREEANFAGTAATMRALQGGLETFPQL